MRQPFPEQLLEELGMEVVYEVVGNSCSLLLVVKCKQKITNYSVLADAACGLSSIDHRSNAYMCTHV